MIRVAICDRTCRRPRRAERDPRRRARDRRRSARADRRELPPLLYRTDPDVVSCPTTAGCLDVRSRARAPARAARRRRFGACRPGPPRGGARARRPRGAPRPSWSRRSAASTRSRPSRRGCSGEPRCTARRHRPRDPRDGPRGHAGPRHRADRRARPPRALRPQRGDRLRRRGRRARRRGRAPRGMTRRPSRRCCVGASRPSSWTGRARRRSGHSSGDRRPGGRSPARAP